MTAIKYWLWLASIKGVPNQIRLSLLNHFGSPERIFMAESGEYLLVEGMTRTVAQLLEDKSLREADRILGECERLGLRVLTLHDAEYPDRLRNIYDPPIVLYVRGRLPLFDDEVAIAMVGPRKASDYALRVGEQLAYQLAAHGAVVVSGLAAGGDAAAHRGALRAGGFTVAVIGGGHDIVYPFENRFLYEDIAVRGVILSEYPPGTHHDGKHFPVRNRIISGLSLGVVVTEAAHRSGTLITASRALDQGRDVFAVPGQIDDPSCAGSNRLLRDGAMIVTEAWDVLMHYESLYPHKLHGRGAHDAQRFGESDAPETDTAPQKKKEEKTEIAEPSLPRLELDGEHGLNNDQITILKALDGAVMQVDDIIETTQIPTRQVLSALTVLEIEGFVTQHSGKRFELCVTLA
ncbi:MAG: DNA-processing protein DprA [Oscillospiraceae bacterium]|nr:DNA-processing protein DprA [Oscillospiraceae bacterium]